MERNRNFFQIFLSTDSDPPKVLPSLIEEASEVSRGHLQGFQYRRWDMDGLRSVITTCFGDEVLTAFDSLRPLAYKADLGRYCLLYQYGGWYADISLKIVSSTLACFSSDSGLCFFRDYGEGMPSPQASCFDCQNSLIFASAGHPVLAACIRKILENVRERYYGLSSTAPTGPSLFGSILAGHDFTDTTQVGFFMPLTQGFSKRNLAYVSDSGEILAWHKTSWHPGQPSGGDMTALGLRGTNNYNRLWRAREVYR